MVNQIINKSRSKRTKQNEFNSVDPFKDNVGQNCHTESLKSTLKTSPPDFLLRHQYTYRSANSNRCIELSDITNFIYAVYLSQLCWLQLSRLRQHMSNNIGLTRTLIKVPLLGEVKVQFCLVSDQACVLGMRIELIRTDNPYADLK